MDDPTPTRPERVLVIGRSPNVILDTAEILRGRGFNVDATNQFDAVLTEYDTTKLDIVVFGGMVPPSTKQRLREEISKANDRVAFVQGLAGIAGLIAAQVEGVTSTAGDDNSVAYDAAARSVRLVLREPTHVLVDAWWATSFQPPEPTSTSMGVIDSLLDSGEHSILLPAEVPSVASFITVSVGLSVHAFTVGPMPEAVTRMVPTGDPAQPPVLPAVRAVATHNNG
jgi:CheY-like chemotaxis protein